MTAPTGDILGADETLKALFERFRGAPDSQAFEELSEALLARGHADEALQIAEHGLQLDPNHVGGRVQRAAALLALQRPRVAYVELQRVLALDKHSQRGLRLLGKVFVDAGVPERAAQLLTRRHKAAAEAKLREAAEAQAKQAPIEAPIEEPPEEKTSPAARLGSIPIPSHPEFDETRRIDINEALGESRPTDAAPVPRPTTGKGQSPMPPPAGVSDLFAELTKDLGLKPERAISTKVEVTQVVRVKRPAKPRDQLSSIDGPIVDMTHPGDLEWASASDVEEISAKTPASLFDVITSPHGLGGVSLDDEPLFHEELPFRIDGVSADEEAGAYNERETVNDDLPAELDFAVLRSAIQREADSIERSDAPEAPSEEVGALKGASTDLPYLKRFERRDVHQSRAPAPPSSGRPALRLAAAPGRSKRVLVLGVAGLLLVAYLLGLAWLSRAQLAVWLHPAEAAARTETPS